MFWICSRPDPSGRKEPGQDAASGDFRNRETFTCGLYIINPNAKATIDHFLPLLPAIPFFPYARPKKIQPHVRFSVVKNQGSPEL